VNFYEALDVDEDADSSDVKRAYRNLARRYHPDVNDHPQASEQFKVLTRARDVLTDSEERSAYDRLGHADYVEKRLDGSFPDPEMVPQPGGGADTGATPSSSPSTTGASTSSSDTGPSATSGSTGSTGTSTANPGASSSSAETSSSSSTTGTSSSTSSAPSGSTSGGGTTTGSSSSTQSTGSTASSSSGTTDEATNSESTGGSTANGRSGGSAGKSHSTPPTPGESGDGNGGAPTGGTSDGSTGTDAMGQAAERVTGTAGKAGQAVTGTAGKAGQAVTGMIGRASQAVTGTAGKAGQAATGTAGKAGQAATGTAGKAGQAVTGAAGKAGQAVTGAAGKAGQAVTGTAGKAGQAVTGTAGKAGQTVTRTKVHFAASHRWLAVVAVTVAYAAGVNGYLQANSKGIDQLVAAVTAGDPELLAAALSSARYGVPDVLAYAGETGLLSGLAPSSGILLVVGALMLPAVLAGAVSGLREETTWRPSWLHVLGGLGPLASVGLVFFAENSAAVQIAALPLLVDLLVLVVFPAVVVTSFLVNRLVVVFPLQRLENLGGE
jgi:curved DNA-binding protein CbpA